MTSYPLTLASLVFGPIGDSNPTLLRIFLRFTDLSASLLLFAFLPFWPYWGIEPCLIEYSFLMFGEQLGAGAVKMVATPNGF